MFDEGPVPQLKEEWLSPEEVEERRFRQGQGTQPEATRRRIYQDLQTRENREDMAFEPLVMSPPRSPLAALPPNSSNTNVLSPPKQRPPREQLPAPRELRPGVLRRNPMRTAKHKGISQLVPTMDASKSYDPPPLNSAATALMSTME